MSHTQLLNALAAAEMEFAHFNAQRTSAAPEAVIAAGADPHFQWLTDASRPGSAYYCRAIAKRVADFPPSALDRLPDSIAAVELRPAEIQPDLTDALLGAGFRPAGALCYLTMRPPAERLAVRHPVWRLDETQVDRFLDLLESAGTGFPPERRAAKRHHYCTAGFQAFVAEDEQGRALGWSTVFRARDYAFLGNSYTLPEARGQGVHAALLAARLNAAAQAGVEHIFTDVEHGSQSHANCERLGLRTVTVNTIWHRRA